MKIKRILLGIVLYGSMSLNASADGLALGNADLEARIAALESLVVQLQEQIASNTGASTTNAQNISGNSNAIGVNAAAVASNAQGISGNSSAIGANAAAVASNAQSIAGNSSTSSANANKLQYVTVFGGELNGVVGPHFIIEGANVHVRSGAGSTREGIDCTNANYDCDGRTGLGNLIVGYNEDRRDIYERVGYDVAGICGSDINAVDGDGTRICTQRTASHSIILGRFHNYAGSSGFLSGRFNETRGIAQSVSGDQNHATGPYAIASGRYNQAVSFASSAIGGWRNTASGPYSVVTAGENNVASGAFSAVSGGIFNTAEGEKSSVTGGKDNLAGGLASSISGGINSRAMGFSSSVSGGDTHLVRGAVSSISGGQMKTADADFCTVGDNGVDC